MIDSARRTLHRVHEQTWVFSRALRLHRIRAVHVAVAATAAFLLALFTWQRCALAGCPNVDTLAAYQPDGGSVLLDRDDRVFAVLRPVRREVVPLAELPEHVGQAFIAIEDHRFYEHGGVDGRRVIGAALKNLRARNLEEGASTITMQLARNAFPDRLPATERTMRRKLLEARVARDIEQRFDKDEILELYLNHIYFGGGAYGVDAAARYFFGKPAARLLQSQAALLAAVVKAPTNYDPRRYPDRARARRNLVLSEMADQGFLSADLAARARDAQLNVIERPPFRGREAGLAPYFVEEVRKILEDRFGDEIYATRMRVHTTLDPVAQQAADEELGRQLRLIERGTYGRFNGERFATDGIEAAAGSPHLEGAVVMLEPKTGDVLALVGGRDYRASSFNRALRSKRQAGSAFKPFVFAAALAQGYPASQLIADEPVSIRLAGNRSWEPENYDHSYYGVVSLRESLILSRNIPTVRLARVVGESEIKSTARQAGIRSDIPETPAMALGAASVTPLELTAAYATFATLGDAAQPRMIRWVADESGTLLWQTPIQTRPALDPAVAYVLTDILRGVVDYGTGTAVRSAGYHGVAAGKTGTTSEGRDIWFVGYTPDIAAAVWIGFDQPRPVLANASGGRLAAPAWGRMMRRVYGERPPAERWRAPETVVWRRFDPTTGDVLAEGCWPTYGSDEYELFIRSMMPNPVCPRPSYGRGWVSSVLDALGIRSRDRDRRRPDRERLEARRDPRREHLEEVLGAPIPSGVGSEQRSGRSAPE